MKRGNIVKGDLGTLYLENSIERIGMINRANVQNMSMHPVKGGHILYIKLKKHLYTYEVLLKEGDPKIEKLKKML